MFRLFRRKQNMVEAEIIDPTGWMLDNPFSEFVLLNTVEIKFMCMIGYTFLTGCKVFGSLPPNTSPSMKFVSLVLACTGGGILVPIFLNGIPVPLANDYYIMAMLISFSLHLTSSHSLTSTPTTTSRSFHTTSTTMSNPVVSYSIDIPSEWTTPKKEGDAIPNVTFLTRTRIESNDPNPFDWKILTSDDLFGGKRVALFSLPGAFTPTCSSTHLPGYHNAYEEFKSLGIDEIYCLSVNDAFVMRKWGLDQGMPEDKNLGSLGFETVKLIPDGACQFTRGMGMSCVWSSNRGFGERSWRYSMVVNNGIIEKLFIEPDRVTNSGPDPFVVSDANTMLTYLKEKAAA